MYVKGNFVYIDIGRWTKYEKKDEYKTAKETA